MFWNGVAFVVTTAVAWGIFILLFTVGLSYLRGVMLSKDSFDWELYATVILILTIVTFMGCYAI